MPDQIIRSAIAVDLPAINDIYNHYVLHSTCTYQTEPESIESRAVWFAAHGPKHPIIVLERKNKIVGWGSLSRFHPRAAYERTVENSVYVHTEHQRQGVGQAILAELISLATRLGHHAIIAGIDADQQASVALHAKHGFTRVGYLNEVGYKFDHWLHVIYMQLMI